MTVSKIFRTTLLMLGTLASAAVMAQTSAANGETVRIQKYPGATSLLAMVALDKGYCSKYGINCVLINNPSSVVSLQALLSGGLEVATPGVETALQLAVKGTPVQFIGNISRTSPYVLAMGGQTPEASLNKSYPALMHDLKGKKIGVTTRGSGPEYVLTTLLHDAGMKKSDVTVVAVGGPDTSYAALVNKQVDAVVSFEPLGAFCEVLKTCHVNLWLSRQGPKELSSMNGAYAPMVVRADYAEKNPKVIKALRSAFKDAETFIQTSANFDELTRIVKKDFKMEHPQSDELIDKMVRNTLPMFYSVLDDPKGLQAASDYMLRTGQINTAFDTSGLVLP